jgi:hypothetical protein
MVITGCRKVILPRVWGAEVPENCAGGVVIGTGNGVRDVVGFVDAI